MFDGEEIKSRLAGCGYIADDALTTTLGLVGRLRRPLLIEGEAGVGKTEVAKALASINGCALIRLQCYDGLDLNGAVYEWNYTRQLIAIKLHEARGSGAAPDVFSYDYLLERPLLESIRQPGPAVLLIDEIDRADEAFEAYLLELLSDFQVSIPELGTIRATHKPMVILTSNGTREISDALRRRCLYHYLDYPDPDREESIVRQRCPGAGEQLTLQIVQFINGIRQLDLRKRPGVAETLDWCAALVAMSVDDLLRDPDLVVETLGCLVKTREDMELLDASVIAETLGRIH